MLRRLKFDLWYLFRPPWDSGVSPPELLVYLESHRPKRAIDLGCGTGTNVLTLIRAGWETTGVDFSARAVRKARRRLRAAGLEANVLVADVTSDLDGVGPYDLALDIGCFHSVRRRDRYLSNLDRLLAPGAHWLLYAFLLDPRGADAIGLSTGDLELVASRGYRLLQRTDGYEGALRRSSWFLYEKVADKVPRPSMAQP